VANLLAPIASALGTTLPVLVDLAAPAVQHHGASTCGAGCLDYAALGLRLSYKVSLQNGTTSSVPGESLSYSALVQELQVTSITPGQQRRLALLLAFPARPDPVGAVGATRAESRRSTGVKNIQRSQQCIPQVLQTISAVNP